MSAAEPRPTRLPSSLTLALAALVPGVAWMVLLVAGSQLDEVMCSSGAAPRRGEWFGVSVRVPLFVLGGITLALTGASVLVLWRGWRVTRGAVGRVPEMRAFMALLGLVSLGLFIPIVVGTIVEIAVFDRC